MEVCCTLGMLEKQQAEELKKAGLTAYNHNLDTSREYYPNIITTRSYDERLATLQHVREAGISVCSGNATFVSLEQLIDNHLNSPLINIKSKPINVFEKLIVAAYVVRNISKFGFHYCNH